MSSFDRREEGFETRFAVDEERDFRARARRNRLLGLWAAGLMGEGDAGAEAYANALVASQVERPDDEAVFEALREGLLKAGVEMSDHRIRRKMDEALAQARAEIAGA